MSNLLSKDLRENYIKEVRAENERTRGYHKADRAKANYVTIGQARENKFALNGAVVPKPNFIGTKVFDNYPLDEIAALIDWTPFFISWEMKGSYPKIFADKERGAEAKKLFDEAQEMLQRIIKEKWLTAKAVVGIYPAKANQDDILVFYLIHQIGRASCRERV